jgi:hypothetical protein
MSTPRTIHRAPCGLHRQMPNFLVYFETMAGTHLADAIRALRDAGSSDALYDPELRATDPKYWKRHLMSMPGTVCHG